MPMRFFMKLDKLILKFVRKNKHVRITRETMKTKSHVRGLREINTPYKACIFKTVCGTDM